MAFPFRYYNARHTIPAGLHPKILFSKGNIFDSAYGFDGIAVFIPPNMGLFNREYDYYVANKEPMNHEYPVIIYGYDWRKKPILKQCDIETKVNESLNYLIYKGCRRIGFHGIRTYDLSEYDCEEQTIKAIHNWINENMAEVDTITLVDYRGGYNYHIRK